MMSGSPGGREDVDSVGFPGLIATSRIACLLCTWLHWAWRVKLCSSPRYDYEPPRGDIFTDANTQQDALGLLISTR
jgi:hypothetical protein